MDFKIIWKSIKLYFENILNHWNILLKNLSEKIFKIMRIFKERSMNLVDQIDIYRRATLCGIYSKEELIKFLDKIIVD